MTDYPIRNNLILELHVPGFAAVRELKSGDIIELREEQAKEGYHK